MKVLRTPILWVLHLGYCWLIIALFLKGLEGWLQLPYHIYLHAFTVGTIGLYILGIMTRAALGHTGRELQTTPVVVLAYILVAIAAVIRTVAPFLTDNYILMMSAVSLLWIIGYALYLWVYTPILTSPRIDGKAG